jgi:predicted ArsR family transcriptional regulator
VVKFAGPVATAPGQGEATDSGTRERVCREVLARGPVTASELADLLGVTPAAVRRHLDLLVADGLATTWDGDAPAAHRRGRGRPARRFVLTDAGHAAMATAYDDLAAAALQFLSEVAGEDAVRRFATTRAGSLAARYGPAVDAAGADPQDRAGALAGALSMDGYAATTRPSPTGAASSKDAGVQLCQGHCPVQHVAERFPQLCEAETAAFSELLGVHVQRLATLAGGAHVCTTHVPATPNRGLRPHVPLASTSTTSRSTTSTSTTSTSTTGTTPTTASTEETTRR